MSGSIKRIPAADARSIAVDGPNLTDVVEVRPARCIVIDSDLGFLQEFARSLRGFGVDIVELLSSARLAEVLDDQAPDVVFIDVLATHPHDAIRALVCLRDRAFPGAVQLLGRCEPAVLESFRRIGCDLSLTMLAVLPKPINFAAVRKTVREQQLERGAIPGELSLKSALARDLVTFWYQPKVDLRMRQVVGAEALVRVSHPEHGILTPEQFMAGADEHSLLELAKRAVTGAIALAAKLEQVGVFLQIGVNIGADAMLKLPAAELLAKHPRQVEQRPWLLFELPEAQVISRVTALREKLGPLESLGAALSIDNCGRGNSSFATFRYLPFWELKIDLSLVQGCAGNKGNGSICKSMVQIAHNFSRSATAVGLETAADAAEVTQFGCDIAQGHLFGPPMSERQLLAMITAGRAESSRFCSSSDWDVTPRPV